MILYILNLNNNNQMKLLLKVLMFVLVTLIINVKVTSATITFSNTQEATTLFSFHTEIPETFFKVFENDLVNYCQKEKDLVDYRNKGEGVEVVLLRRECNIPSPVCNLGSRCLRGIKQGYTIQHNKCLKSMYYQVVEG